MSFHKCGGNIGDDMTIPLPNWIAEIGSVSPDIYFTDREGRRNTECLTWGIDKVRVLRGRTALEVVILICVVLNVFLLPHTYMHSSILIMKLSNWIIVLQIT